MNFPDTSKHKLDVPQAAGQGLNDWVTTCKCGARWRVYYGQGNHLTWRPLNEQARVCPLGAMEGVTK